jgi:RNA polymerase sigma factor (sigma-70 family)
MAESSRLIDVGAAGDGDRFPSGFEAFYRNHYPQVVRLAQSVLGDFHGAQDVAQEVFIAAHDRYRGDVARAPGWVRVAAVHAALNVVRGDRRRARRHRLSAPGEAVPGPEEAVIDAESRAQVRRALSRLPARSATVLVLRHGGMSYVDIAGATGAQVGQVGTMLRRAEAALAKELNHESRP